MPKVVGVRFHGQGKAFDFDAGDLDIRAGDAVIVETREGIEYGFASSSALERDEAGFSGALKPVLRFATDEDTNAYKSNLEHEREAYRVCKDLIQKHELNMSLVTVAYTFDEQKIMFYFTAEKRVDFRALVRDLAQIFHRRIELRQIGVRDEARMIGGLGNCGRPFCCATFLEDFIPVSVKMAKMQSLSMNPTKISGCCGRLMCCLKYEQEAYEDARKRAPKQGAKVMTPKGEGKVVGLDLLRERASVHLLASDENERETFAFTELSFGGCCEGGCPRRRQKSSEGRAVADKSSDSPDSTPVEKSVPSAPAAGTDEAAQAAGERPVQTSTRRRRRQRARANTLRSQAEVSGTEQAGSSGERS